MKWGREMFEITRKAPRKRIVSPETRAATSAAMKRRFADPKNRAAHSATMAKAYSSPERRAALSVKMKKMLADPARRARAIANLAVARRTHTLDFVAAIRSLWNSGMTMAAVAGALNAKKGVVSGIIFRYPDFLPGKARPGRKAGGGGNG